MTRTTPPRPFDIETLFPELAAHRGTCTRLHPRPGTPTPYDSSVGGPLLWPADEPWPTCTQEHRRNKGRRIADIHEERRLHAEAKDRPLTDEERERLTTLQRRHKLPDIEATHPVPLLPLAQLYARDVPNLPAPPGLDLLQVLWCPFEAHGFPHAPAVHLRRRDSTAALDAVLTNPPLPAVVGYEGLVPEPCVLHPEPGVVEYEWPELLDEDLQSRIEDRGVGGEPLGGGRGIRRIPGLRRRLRGGRRLEGGRIRLLGCHRPAPDGLSLRHAHGTPAGDPPDRTRRHPQLDSPGGRGPQPHARQCGPGRNVQRLRLPRGPGTRPPDIPSGLRRAPETRKARRSGHPLPYSMYSAPGALRQGPPRAAESSA